MPLEPLKEPTGKLGNFIATARGVTASSLLMVTLLLFNLMQVMISPLLLFAPTLFRKINRWAANTWWGWCDRTATLLYQVKFDFTGDDVPSSENALVVCNHQQMADITVLFRFARMKERLGDLKWFVKDIIKYVPGVGWGMLWIDCFFVQRDWTSDREKINRVFEKVHKFNIPFWIMMFVEGTRFKTGKLAASHRFAEKSGLKKLNHLLMPRTKGFVASVNGLRDRLDAVYDVTIGYEQGVPTLWQWIKGRVRRVHLHVRRYAVGELPKEAEAISDWLNEIYIEKDALLAYYYKVGEFPATRNVES